MEEKIIKSKERVQKHGEVFTPRWVVDKMLDQEGVKEACQSLGATFLEPAVGEGVFLVAILERKLEVAYEKYGQNLARFESYSLLALSSLYGIELLEDNVQICTMNLYQVFYKNYEKVCSKFKKKPRDRVLRSARTIITTNIEQGDFLTRLKADGTPIIITDWRPKLGQTVQATRTEISLIEVFEGYDGEPGRIYGEGRTKDEQISMFDIISYEEEDLEVSYKYKTCDIRNVYKEELEEI